MKGERYWADYAWALCATGVCTVLALAMAPRFDLVNIAMVYLLGVVVIALRFTRGAAILTALLCVGFLDFLFVPPRGTFTVDDVQYLLTFAIMVAVALVISKLVDSARREERSRSALEMEAETERIRSSLLASISHDLRTPLAVMTGASSSLAERGERLGPQERAALAKSLFDQTREMSEHVAKVLEMTRLEKGTIRVDRDWASLDEIAGSVLRRLGERLSAHRVMLDMPDDLPLVRVDAALIEQALANLLENAAKYTPQGTVVRLRAQSRAEHVLVSVEDFGNGIPEADMERVFAKFHRGTSEGGGMGLGLAICRSIVRLHRGNAWAEAMPGGGTAFRFTLPVEEAPPIPAEPVGA